MAHWSQCGTRVVASLKRIAGEVGVDAARYEDFKDFCLAVGARRAARDSQKICFAVQARRPVRR
jgi:hypothetical protein